MRADGAKRGSGRCRLLPQGGARSRRSNKVGFPLLSKVNMLDFVRSIGTWSTIFASGGGDSADKYFKSTEQIAGVKDMRFQALMPDVLHWLGIKKIDNMVSMSDM